MNQFTPSSPARMTLMRLALFVIPVIMLLGSLSAAVSGSTEKNAWYQTLIQPAAQPPGWVFGLVWPTLFFLMGLAFAMVLHARGSLYQRPAVALFVAQFLINLTWSPAFFHYHKVTAAFYIIGVLLAMSFATTFAFARVRKAAAWLMVPYLVWISFAAILNFQIDQLNPDAESLYVPAVTPQIG